MRNKRVAEKGITVVETVMTDFEAEQRNARRKLRGFRAREVLQDFVQHSIFTTAVKMFVIDVEGSPYKHMHNTSKKLFTCV